MRGFPDGSRRGLLRVLQRRSFRHTAAQGPDSPQCATASQSERGGTEDAPHHRAGGGPRSVGQGDGVSGMFTVPSSSFSSMDLGTRNGIWHALELLHHTCPPSRPSSPAPPPHPCSTCVTVGRRRRYSYVYLQNNLIHSRLIVHPVQQLALSIFGLKHYVRTAPRSSLISANKEGIASLAGLSLLNNTLP